MKQLLMLLVLLGGITCFKSAAQKRYGFTILHFRCGEDDSQRDRVYFSPIVELNTLNFPRYTDGMDPSIARYSVRYYNYAISKWFEIYLKEKFQILINTPEKYARKSSTSIFNENNKAFCNPDKTTAACFFLDKEALSANRKKAIDEKSSPANKGAVCEVIAL